MTKAAVLPVPFLARARISRPVRATGMASSWMGEGFSKPASKIPMSKSRFKAKFSNSRPFVFVTSYYPTKRAKKSSTASVIDRVTEWLVGQKREREEQTSVCCLVSLAGIFRFCFQSSFRGGMPSLKSSSSSVLANGTPQTMECPLHLRDEGQGIERSMRTLTGCFATDLLIGWPFLADSKPRVHEALGSLFLKFFYPNRV